jgi:phospholipase A-2-activating protein
VQTLQHPTTVWSVAGLENGDVVTGCADGIARVWSARPEAALPADQLAAYQAKVTNVPIAKYAPFSCAVSRVVCVLCVLCCVVCRLTGLDLYSKRGSIGDLNVEKLPGREALETPGRTEGDRLMVRNGNTVEVYLWDSAQSQWTKFGEVVDAASTPAKSLQDGREYDYVFDVDLGDGLPARKLGYNATGAFFTFLFFFLL